MKSVLIRFLVINIVLIVFSCQKENDNSRDYDLLMVLNQDINTESFYLQDAINKKLLVLKDIDTLAITYNLTTNNYLEKIKKVIKDLTLNIKNYDINALSNTKIGNAYFFEEDNYSYNAKEFILATENFRNEAEILIKDNEVLSLKLNRITDTSEITNKNGTPVSKLDYLYKNMSLVSILTHLANLELNILLIEDAYLYERLIKNKMKLQ